MLIFLIHFCVVFLLFALYFQFKFATGWELFLMFIGTVSALIHGIALPSTMLILGNVVQAIVDGTREDMRVNGSTPQSSLDQVADDLYLNSAWFAVLAGGSFITSYIQVTFPLVFWDLCLLLYFPKFPCRHPDDGLHRFFECFSMSTSGVHRPKKRVVSDFCNA